MSVIPLGRNMLASVDAERIKLASIRSPWWCGGAAVLATVGVNALIVVSLAAEGTPVTVALTQLATTVGMSVVMVLACLAVTGEYAVGTIRTTFLAVPRRRTALLAKGVVVGAVAAVIGLVVAFASWGVAHLIAPSAGLALSDSAAWRQVAGAGLVYLLASGFALAVGILVRYTAGALAIVLGWTLLVEPLLGQIPGIGPVIAPWLPFRAAKQFLADVPADAGLLDRPWVALAWFAVVSGGLMAVALWVARRRDA